MLFIKSAYQLMRYHTGVFKKVFGLAYSGSTPDKSISCFLVFGRKVLICAKWPKRTSFYIDLSWWRWWFKQSICTCWWSIWTVPAGWMWTDLVRIDGWWNVKHENLVRIDPNGSIDGAFRSMRMEVGAYLMDGGDEVGAYLMERIWWGWMEACILGLAKGIMVK